MSQLTIDPNLGSALKWAVGKSYTIPVTGTVTAMTPEGGYTLDVTAVTPEKPPEEAMEEEPDTTPGPSRPSAVNRMLGKY